MKMQETFKFASRKNVPKHIYIQNFLPKLLFKFINPLLTNYIPYILPSLTNQNVSLTLRHVDV